MFLVEVVDGLNRRKHVVVVVLLSPEGCPVVLKNHKGLVFLWVLWQLSYDLLCLVPGSVNRHHGIYLANFLFRKIRDGLAGFVRVQNGYLSVAPLRKSFLCLIVAVNNRNIFTEELA